MTSPPLGKGVSAPKASRLDCGLRLVTRQVPTLENVCTWLIYNAGSVDEEKGATGSAHYVEHVMFKATEKYPRGAADRLIESRGGSTNAWTSKDFTGYTANAPADMLADILDIDADHMANAPFDPEVVEAERGVILSEWEGGESDPRERLETEVWSLAFREVGYRWPVIGWRSDIAAVTRDQLYNFYRRHYRPGNAVLCVIGPHEHGKVAAIAQEKLGAANLPSNPNSEPPKMGEERDVHRSSTLYEEIPAGFHLRIYRTVPHGAPEQIPCMLASAILGAGRSSRLFRVLVRTGEAAAAASAHSELRHAGVLTVSVALNPDSDSRRVRGICDEEIARFAQSGPTPEELKRAKRQVLSAFWASAEMPWEDGIAMAATHLLSDYTFYTQIPELVARVQAEEVGVAAATLLKPERCAEGTLLPRGKTS